MAQTVNDARPQPAPSSLHFGLRQGKDDEIAMQDQFRTYDICVKHSKIQRTMMTGL